MYIDYSFFGNFIAGIGDMWPNERDIFYSGGIFRFVLPDQFNVGRGCPELRRRSGNHTRGTYSNTIFFLSNKQILENIKCNLFHRVF